VIKPTKPRPSYKVTFFDRHGAAGALRLKAFGYAMIVFGCSIVMFGAASVKMGLGLPGLILFTLAGSTTLAGAAMYMGLRGGSAAGDFAQYVTAGGSGTPYEDQFSEEQARVMQSDFAGAAALFEHRIAMNRESPDPRVLLAAADLYATHAANPTRAAELYREVQRLPSATPGQDVYASNKLADLYLGALQQPGRALVEFRRLIHRYPDSRTAGHARMALANLKPDLLGGSER
jgi:hypothetical protein